MIILIIIKVFFLRSSIVMRDPRTFTSFVFHNVIQWSQFDVVFSWLFFNWECFWINCLFKIIIYFLFDARIVYMRILKPWWIHLGVVYKRLLRLLWIIYLLVLKRVWALCNNFIFCNQACFDSWGRF